MNASKPAALAAGFFLPVEEKKERKRRFSE
jgi:hypothetical protein